MMRRALVTQLLKYGALLLCRELSCSQLSYVSRFQVDATNEKAYPELAARFADASFCSRHRHLTPVRLWKL